jgi:ABC-type transport system involved in multi-copper enzyme maturation permease subunit
MATLLMVANVLNRLVRNKLLIVTLLVALLIIGLMSSSLLMVQMATEAGEVATAQTQAAVAFFGVIFLMGIFTNLVGLVTGATVTRQEIRDGTIFSVLAKPVTRWEYLLGSYLGGVSYLLLIWVMVAAIHVGLVYLMGQELSQPHVLSLLGRATLSLLLLSLAFCLAQRFSTWVAAVLSVVMFNGDQLVTLIANVFELMKLSFPDGARRALAFPFPATDSLDAVFESLLKTRLESPPVGWAFLHLVDYSAVMVLLAWWLFRRQDLSPTTE